MLTLPAQVAQEPDMTQMKTIPSHSATTVMAKVWLPWTCAQTVVVPVKHK